MRFYCKSCGCEKEVGDQYAGKTVKCPQCKQPVKIPERERQGDNRYSIAEFVRKTGQKNRQQGLFELETNNMLEINVNGHVWTKLGSMIAYTGNLKFTREGVLEHGVGKLLKKSFSGEGATLTRAEGKGALYLADAGKKVSVLQLDNDTIVVNGNDLLAFESSVEWDITMMKKVAGMLSGGLFNIRLSGRGMIAITTHHDPLTLQVTANRPVVTDPNATVAWSGNLSPDLKTDISFKTFLGRGSGESIQMRFAGKGFVVVQPFEEVYMQA